MRSIFGRVAVGTLFISALAFSQLVLQRLGQHRSFDHLLRPIAIALACLIAGFLLMSRIRRWEAARGQVRLMRQFSRIQPEYNHFLQGRALGLLLTTVSLGEIGWSI